jgi:phosphoribosylanthranilate isomerase
MAKVKICGLTRKEDIEYVNELLPDYVGFVFAKSKRQVTLDKAKELMNLLDKKIQTVGVFQDEEIDKVKHTAEYLKLDIIQLHGNEDGDYVKKLYPFKVWKSLGIDAADSLDNNDLLQNRVKFHQENLDKLSLYEIESLLVDSSVKGAKGGTGISFNWDILNDLVLNKKIILAGGLNCENIQRAIEKVKPYAVDVSSGVEENKIKNYDKMKSFIEKVRTMI